MIVAPRLSSSKSRQFIAWNRSHEGHRPVGYGMIVALYGVDRLFWHIPGNKLPGYHHSAPSGQQTVGTGSPVRLHIRVLE
jgi:hypothetical protein